MSIDPLFTTINTPLRLSSDIDSDTDVIRVALNVSKKSDGFPTGTVTLTRTNDLSVLNGNGSSSLYLKGALDDVNAALNNIIFQPTDGYSGISNISISTNDRRSQRPIFDYERMTINIVE